MAIEFNEVLFRAQCPAFADATKYPTALLALYWSEVIEFVSSDDYGDFGLSGRTLALNMLLAHFLLLAAGVAKGKQGGFVSGSSVDKISVTKVAPNTPDNFSWWLSQTPYGQQLMALLEVNSVGGFYLGGMEERSGFRKAGGGFA